MNSTEVKQDVVEHHRLFAEFMGGEWKDKTLFRFNEPPAPHCTFHWNDFAMQYNQSWDWFMMVYKKFKDYLQEQYRKPTHNKNAITRADLIEVDIQCAVKEFDLPKAHKHLVMAIKWYNNQGNTAK